jgi:rhodanese-related sulfurtransferase
MVSASEIARIAKDRAPQPIVFIDASPLDIQQRVRLTGSLRFDDLDATKHPYPQSASIVVYDFSLGGSGAHDTARAWVSAGYKFVYILRGGFASAREAKLSVDVAAAPVDALPYTVPAKSLSDALKQQKEEMVIIDLRSDIEFSVEHIPDAINLQHAELLSKIAATDKAKWIVLYDSLGNSHDPLIWQLREAGYLQTVSLVGGYKSWVELQAPKPLEGR